jgi:hypothetical protein
VFAYFFEAGLLLLVVPWSAFWERNFFVTRLPTLGEVLLNHFVRGAISGVGLVCLGAALGELAAILALRRGHEDYDSDRTSGGPGDRP